MRPEGRFVELLHLGVQPVIHEGGPSGPGLVLDVEVDELGAQPHHLRDAPDEVIGHLVAEAQPVALMLVQRHGPLAPPAPLILFQLDLVVFLGIPAGSLAL